MRRLLSAFAAVALVGALVLGAAFPASAAEPLPPGPVDPIGTLPSTYQKSVFTGSSLMDDQIKFGAWVLQQAKAASASGATAGAVANAVPVAPAAPLKAGATGSALTGAFMAGWMITDGTLAMYANVTGEDPMMGTCALTGLAQASVQILYPFSAPDCKADIIANQDALGGDPTFTYQGFTVLFRGSNGTTYCFNRSAATPSGYTLSARLANGASGGINFGSSGTSYGLCVQAGFGASGTNTGWHNNSTTPAVGAQLTRQSDGQVVAETATPSSDPGRVPHCDIKWRDGSTTSAVGTAAQKYNDSAGIPLGLFSSLCNDAYVSKPGRGPALMPSEIKIGSTRDDNGAYTEIQNNPVPEYTEEEKRGLTAPAPGGGLQLHKVINGAVQSCMTWEAECVGWWTATEQGTQESTDTGTYRCTYNGQQVSLTQCSPYRETFDTKTQTPTITDPFNGEKLPWSAGAPGWSVITPGVTGGGGCGAPFSLNPVDWVVNPLKCLFIPGQAAIDAFQARVEGGIGDSLIGPIQNGLAALGDAFNSGIGCGGLPVHIEAFGTVIVHTYLLASCDEPAAGLAATAKTVLTVGIWGGAILACTRYLGALFAFTAYGGESRSRSSGVSFD